MLCDFTCPSNCTCYGHAFFCTGTFLPSDYQELRYLHAPNTDLILQDFQSNVMLIFLNLAHCDIVNISDVNFPVLRHLDLSFNKLRVVSSKQLMTLKNLLTLSLSGNPVVKLFQDSITKDGIPSYSHNLLSLDLSSIEINTLNVSMLSIFPKLSSLNLSSCGVRTVNEGFYMGVERLTILDLEGCPMDTFPRNVLKHLPLLTNVR